MDKVQLYWASCIPHRARISAFSMSDQALNIMLPEQLCGEHHIPVLMRQQLLKVRGPDELCVIIHKIER